MGYTLSKLTIEYSIDGGTTGTDTNSANAENGTTTGVKQYW